MLCALYSTLKRIKGIVIVIRSWNTHIGSGWIRPSPDRIMGGPVARAPHMIG